MSAWDVFWIMIGVIVIGLILFNFRDLCRYIKISIM